MDLCSVLEEYRGALGLRAGLCEVAEGYGQRMSTSRAILQLMLTPGVGDKTLWAILRRLSNEQQAVDAYVALPPADIASIFKLKLEVAAGVAGNREQAAALADELDAHEIQLLYLGGPGFPEHLSKALGRDAPPVLFAHGNLAILTQPAIGIAGSRKASKASLQAVVTAASTLAAAGLNIVSGYANGVDLAAHGSALAAGGATTLVLAEGIMHYRVKAEIAEHLSDTNHLVLSEFPPTLRWIARNAMQRNRTIVGLSAGLVIVESGEDGGTFAAGEEALKRRAPLFVLRYPVPPPPPSGNETLIRRGGYPIIVDEAGHIDLSPVLESALSTPNSPSDGVLWRDDTPR